MSTTMEAIIIVLIFFFMSLLGSYIILRLLKGTAFIKRKGIRLGGTAAMFVVIFVLLNNYYPKIREGLSEEAQAAQPVRDITEKGEVDEFAKVSISPSKQSITLQDLHRLDRNKYQIFEDEEIAFPRPSSDLWKLNKLDSIPIIGIADIPMIEMGISLFRKNFEEISPTVIGIRKRAMYSIILNDKSTIDGIPMDFNFYEDIDYVKASVKGQIEMGIRFGISAEELSLEEIQEFQTYMLNSTRSAIKSELPLQHEISSGLYVMFFPNEKLEKVSLLKIGGKTPLDRVLTLINFSGLFYSNSMATLYINEEKQFASFNSTVTLGNVKIDGRTTDALFNNIGFIVVGKERAIYVLMVYISPVDKIQVYIELEKFLHLIRFTV